MVVLFVQNVLDLYTVYEFSRVNPWQRAFDHTNFGAYSLAIDEALSAQFRAALNGMVGISEKKMMGGMCFMLNGNMIGGAHRMKTGEGRFMFRVGKDNHEAAQSRPGAMPMDFTGRVMRGFVFVDADACEDDLLKDWLSLALSFVSTLPAK